VASRRGEPPKRTQVAPDLDRISEKNHQALVRRIEKLLDADGATWVLERWGRHLTFDETMGVAEQVALQAPNLELRSMAQ